MKFIKGVHIFSVFPLLILTMSLDYTSICQMRKLRYREISDLLKHLQPDGSGGGTRTQVWLTQVWATFPHGQQVNNAKLIVHEKGKSFAGWEGLGRWERPCNEWQEFLRKPTLSLMEFPNSKAVLKMVIMSICKWFCKGLWVSSILTGVKRTDIVCPLKKEQPSGLHCLELVSKAYRAYFWG